MQQNERRALSPERREAGVYRGPQRQVFVAGVNFNPAYSLHKFLEINPRDEVALKSLPAINSGCPTLAAFLLLRLGWDTTKLNHPRFVSGHGFSRADKGHKSAGF